MGAPQWIQKKCREEEIVETVKGNQGQLSKYLNRIGILLILVTVLVAIILVITVIIALRTSDLPINVDIFSKNHSDQPAHQVKNMLKNSPMTGLRLVLSDPEGNLTVPNKLNLISRLEWLAQPPVKPPNPLIVPVPYVIIHQTGTGNCSTKSQCMFYARFIQIFHIESKKWWDIGYNFLVGGDGAAYEGRGWEAEGAHTYGYDLESIGIAFIGSFNSFKPPQKQITACKQLIAKGVELGYIKRDYKLLTPRQLQNTQNPGTALFEDIKTWDRWSKTP